MLGFNNPEDEEKAISVITSMSDSDAGVDVLHKITPEILKPLFEDGEVVEEFGYDHYHRVRWDDRSMEVVVEVLLDWGFAKNFRTAQFTLRKRNGEMQMVRRAYRQYTVGPDGVPTLSNEVVCNSLDELAERKICAGKTLEQWVQDFAEDYDGPDKGDRVNHEVGERRENIGHMIEVLRKTVDAICYKADGARGGRWRTSFGIDVKELLSSIRTPDDRPSGQPKRHGKPKTGGKPKNYADDDKVANG